MLFADGVDLVPGRQRLDDFAFGIALLDHVAGQQADQLPGAVHDRESAEGKLLFFNHAQHFTDHLVRGDFDRVLDQAVDMVLDAADFGQLLSFGHIVMEEAQTAVQGHGDGHARFGHRIHVR